MLSRGRANPATAAYPRLVTACAIPSQSRARKIPYRLTNHPPARAPAMVNATPRVTEIRPISLSEYPRSTQNGLTMRPSSESPSLNNSTKSTTGTISHRNSQRSTGTTGLRRSLGSSCTRGLAQTATARTRKSAPSAIQSGVHPVVPARNRTPPPPTSNAMRAADTRTPLMAPLLSGVDTSTAQASIAMSCVADAAVNAARTAHRNQEGWAASCGTMRSVATASAARHAVIHCCRAPQRSTSGAHSIFHVQGSDSRLMRPISLSETPCTRKYTGQTSYAMPNGSPSAK